MTACDEGVDNRVVWSPDGTRAAVSGSGKISLCDEGGKLSDPALLNSKLFRWAPDSVHAYVVTATEVSSWKDVQLLLTPAERSEVVRVARMIWQTTSLAKLKKLSPSRSDPALVYLSHKYGTRAVWAKLRSLDKNVPNLSEPMRVTLSSVQLFDSSTHKFSSSQLWRTVAKIEGLSVAPNGKFIAISVSDDSQSRIVVVPASGGDSKIAVTSLALSPVWSADSRSLFYIDKPSAATKENSEPVNSPQHPVIGTINTLEVVGANDHLLPVPGPAKQVVQVLVGSTARLRCLPNGDILFDAMTRSFPDIKSDGRCGLFRLSPDLQRVVRIESLSPLPDGLDYFEPNKGGTRIAVPGSKGEIAVLDVASGNVIMVEKPGKKSFRLAPVWRTEDELCYAAPNAERSTAGHDTEVVLQSVTDVNKRAVLSKDWSSSAFDFLTYEDCSEKKVSKTAVKKIHQGHHRTTKGTPGVRRVRGKGKS